METSHSVCVVHDRKKRGPGTHCMYMMRHFLRICSLKCVVKHVASFDLWLLCLALFWLVNNKHTRLISNRSVFGDGGRQYVDPVADLTKICKYISVVYGEFYDLQCTRISGTLCGACADSGYQALHSPNRASLLTQRQTTVIFPKFLLKVLSNVCGLFVNEILHQKESLPNLKSPLVSSLLITKYV